MSDFPSYKIPSQSLYLIIFGPCVNSDFSFQESKTERVPYCFFSDNLYTVHDIQYEPHGATALLSLRSQAQASAFPSTPVSSLRLSVIYHKNDMLQFKVCVCSVYVKDW